jgi:TRAP-type C4-dicarboxylate transport system permease large subunit
VAFSILAFFVEQAGMLAKVLIIVSLLAIAYTLGSSFYSLVRDQGEGRRTVHRLTWRVGLSLLLFVVILAALAAGWLQPGSSGPVRYPPEVQSEPADP